MNRKPLKRHPALIPLSREHHQGLLLAQLLKQDVPDYKGMPNTSAGKVAYARQLYEQALRSHFDKEEQRLAPRTRDCSPELAAMARRVAEEHRQIRAGIDALRPDSSPAQLDELGRLLERHIRFEEREWFAAIQRGLPDEALGQLWD